jgi:outer membrane lipoprotein-sorting protein
VYLSRTTPALIALACLTAPFLKAQAPELSLDQIIAKHFEAEGGIEKQKATQTQRVTAHLVGMPMEIKFVTEHKRPSFVRVDQTVQGQTATEAYDGKTGWKVNPFAGYGGGKAVEAMTAEELSNFEIEADINGPLMDYKTKGHAVELLGTESAEGVSAYKLKITLKNGQVQIHYFDTESFLRTKQIIKRKERGQDVELEMILGDYKEVDGILTPFSFEIGAPGSTQKAKVRIDKVEFNIPIEDSRFKAPATPAPKSDEKKG